MRKGWVAAGVLALGMVFGMVACGPAVQGAGHAVAGKNLPTPAAKAERLTQSLGVEALISGQVDLMIAGIAGATPPALVAALRSEMAGLPKIAATTAAGLYGAALSPAELDAINTFLESQSGLRFAKAQMELAPLLAQEEASLAGPASQRFQAALVGALQPPALVRARAGGLDPARLALADAVVDLMRKREAIAQTAVATLQKNGATFAQIEVYKEAFGPVWDGLAARAGEVFAGKLSQADLDAAIAFFSSPEGTAFAEKDLRVQASLFEAMYTQSQAAGERARMKVDLPRP